MLTNTNTMSSVYLGPARVVEIGDRRVRLRLHDQEFWATVALAVPYEVAKDDVVLAISQENDWYVIGLLRGAGTTTLTVPGDLAIKAPHGKIHLQSGQEVTIQGPKVRLKAGILEVTARSVCEKFVKAARWVQDTYRLHAERMLTRVPGEYRLRAGAIKESAKEDVRIDGKKIHLG